MPDTPRPHPGAHPLTRRAALVGLAAGAAALLPAPAWAATEQRPGAVRAPRFDAFDRRIVRELSAERALGHISELSEGIGPRIGGTESEHRAAQYLAGQLDDLGYTVRLEPFAVADKFLAQLSASPELAPDLCWQAGASPQGALDVTATGPVVDVRAGTAADYPADATGAVLLVDSTAATRNAQVALAVARGAAAVVLLPADLVAPRQAQAASPALTAPAPVPVVGVAQSQKAALRERLAAGPYELTVATTAHRNLTSHNVLGERAGRGGGRGPRRAVAVSGHYDSVIGAPGANDDASGTALALEVGRAVRRLPTPADVRVSLWGSEEQGLLGSRFHVAQLDQPARDRLVAVFQNDMVATSWDPATRYWLLSFTGEPNTATDAVTAAGQRLGYAPRMSPVTERGASDHQSFQEVGIASANFSWRGEESPALLEPPYHSPMDSVARNISLERLQVSLELIGCALYAVARQG